MAIFEGRLFRCSRCGNTVFMALRDAVIRIDPDRNLAKLPKESVPANWLILSNDFVYCDACAEEFRSFNNAYEPRDFANTNSLSIQISPSHITFHEKKLSDEHES